MEKKLQGTQDCIKKGRHIDLDMGCKEASHQPNDKKNF
jgi:hypothetical protein